MSSTREQTQDLITSWYALHHRRSYLRIHTSIYDTKGYLVIADGCEDAIEHLADTLGLKGDQEYFEEVYQDYIKAGEEENDAYTKASEGFYFLNGAEALDISDWMIRDMNEAERKIANRIGHLALVDERTTDEQTELEELLDELEN